MPCHIAVEIIYCCIYYLHFLLIFLVLLHELIADPRHIPRPLLPLRRVMFDSVSNAGTKGIHLEPLRQVLDGLLHRLLLSVSINEDERVNPSLEDVLRDG